LKELIYKNIMSTFEDFQKFYPAATRLATPTPQKPAAQKPAVVAQQPVIQLEADEVDEAEEEMEVEPEIIIPQPRVTTQPRIPPRQTQPIYIPPPQQTQPVYAPAPPAEEPKYTYGRLFGKRIIK
jgi:hypothetical protein